MKISIFSSFFPEVQKSEIRSLSKGNIDNASDTLQTNLIKGLMTSGLQIDVLNIPNIGSYPIFFKKMRLNEVKYSLASNLKITSLSFLNIPVFKNRIIIWQLVKQFKKIVNTENQERQMLFIYGMSFHFLKAASIIKSKYSHIRICLMVPDLPEYMNNPKNKLLNLRLLLRPNLYGYIKYIDGFVVLTQYIAKRLGVCDKPWIVIEGLVNINDFSSKVSFQNSTVLMYAGTLAERYGIIDLLKAFGKTENPKYELWICGDGDSKKVVINYAKSDSRIKYFGLLSREETLKLMNSATALVNPRTSMGEFTKFSFPSKTLEYMLSGKPVIMHKLPGLPREYEEYLFLTSGDTIEYLYEKIEHVMSLSLDERIKIGNSAKKFVSESKNSEFQSKKIIQLFEKINNAS